MTAIGIVKSVGISLLLYFLALLTTVPLMLCGRWLLHFCLEQRSAFTTLKLVRLWNILRFAIAFTVATGFSGLLAVAMMDGLRGGTKYTPSSIVYMAAVLLAIVAAGIVFLRAPSSLRRPEVVRISQGLAERSSPNSRKSLVVRMYWYVAMQTYIVIVALFVSLSIFLRALSGTDTEALVGLLDYIVVASLGPVVPFMALRLVSPTPRMFLAVNRVLKLWSKGKESTHSWPSKDVVGLRNDLRSISQVCRRIARRLRWFEVNHPASFIYDGAAGRIRSYLGSLDSLNGKTSGEVMLTLTEVTSLRAGGCPADFFETTCLAKGIFNETSNSVSPERPSRFTRFMQVIVRSAEPTDKVLSTFAKLVAIVLVLLLAIVGQVSLTDLVERLPK